MCVYGAMYTWQSNQSYIMLYLQPCMSRFYLYTATHVRTAVFEIDDVVYNNNILLVMPLDSLSAFINDVHTMIDEWCECFPLVCIYGRMHGVVELYLVWECDHISLRMLYLQPCMSRFYLYTVTHVHTVVFKVVNVVYANIPMHH